MQPEERALSYRLISADIFIVTNKTLLCIVDYHSTFPTVKKVGSPAVDDLEQMAKMIFAEYALPKKIISDAGTNFTSETFRVFCTLMSIQ